MNPEESKITEGAQTPPKQEDPKGGKRLSKSRPVTVYLAVMFVVALLLLLMSFFMQQRSHQVLEDLNESVSRNQDLNALQIDKQHLEFQLEETKDDLAQREEQVDRLEKQVQAMEWLRQMENATRTSYSQAKELVAQFEETGLADYLPTDPILEGEEESPAEAYRDIYAMFN